MGTYALLSECGKKEEVSKPFSLKKSDNRAFRNGGSEGVDDIDILYNDYQQDFSALLGDQCQFSCIWCHFECQSYFQYNQHVKRNHSDKIKIHLLTNDAEAHSSKLRLTKCHFCKLPIPHDSYCLLLHLMQKHRNFKLSWVEQTFDYVAAFKHRPKKTQANIFHEMQKCFVTIKLSKYVQQVKDDRNREIVPFVAWKNFHGTNNMDQICFKSKKLPVKATNNIGNLCLFECYKCHIKFYSCYTLIRHATQDHFQSSCRSTIYAVVNKSIKRARYHCCRVCNKTILCDLRYINKHLNKHKIHMKDYMFIKLKHLKDSLVPISNYTFNGLSLTSFETLEVPEASYTTAVENLCHFRCDKCSITYHNTGALKNHLKTCKRTTKFEPNYVLNAVFHKCKICSLTMLCDKAVIWRHLHFCHAIELSAYTAKTHLQLRDTNARTKKLPLVKKISRVPIVSPLKRICNFRGSLPKHLTTSIVGDYCSFACDKCNFRSHSWGGMKNHNVNCDQGPGHSKFDSKYLREARYHTCKVCERILLCDTSVIKAHVKISHGYHTMEKYQKLCYRDKEVKSLIGETNYNKHYFNMEESLTKAPPVAQTAENSSKQPTHITGQKREMITKEFRNLIHYKCDKCNMLCKSYGSITTHSSRCVGTKTFNKKNIVELAFHKCNICYKKVMCDKHIIANHVRRRHKMSTEEYLALLLKDQVKESFKYKYIKEVGCLEERVKVFPSALPTLNNSFVISKELLHDTDSTSLLRNLCLFKCISCNYLSTSWSDMACHARILHQKEESKIQFQPEYVKQAVYHKCHLCENRILCDKELIMRHLRKQHKIYVFQKYKSLGQNLKKEIKMGVHLSSTKVYEKSYTILPSHVDQSMISSKTNNSCIFSCDKCSFVKSSWTDFRHHKRSLHNDARFEYDPKYVKSAKYYQCPLCQMFTLCDRTIILCHLNRHKFRSIKKFDAWLEENKENRSLKI